MNRQTLEVCFSGLLHDIGKLVYRAGENRDHASAGYEYLKARLEESGWKGVLDGVRWHHASALRQAKPAEANLAYIVCVADNVAAAADRRAWAGSPARRTGPGLRQVDRASEFPSGRWALDRPEPAVAARVAGRRVRRAEDRFQVNWA